jgi:hypothetical protein
VDVVEQFKEFTDQELAEKVDEFAEARGLAEHSELLVRGAILARDVKNAVTNYTKFSDLSDDQKKYLEQGEKKAGFWGQSKYLKGSLLSACLAGVIQ